ncbi:MAG: hypothetical protein EPGJADBJ_04598 [Saprospiraceae bacterium]|nr:hypothetical protein [Saprospiraceae bacterium]
MKHLFFLLFFAFFSAPFACNAQTPTRLIILGPGHVALLLDSADAAKAITTDRYDKFFERVTASEMSIQMKQPLAAGQTSEALLPAYTDFLKADVESFSAGDIEFIEKVLKKMFKTVGEVNAKIFPDTIKLIVTKSKHYGAGVWYTRDNCIVIPKGELEAKKTNAFTNTMYHELFHIYSRLNPAKRAKLYHLIGFEHIGFDKLMLPPALAERILFNPDGVDFAQKIELALADNTMIQAIPVIYANHVGAKAGRNEFFGYLEFNLFQIQPNGEGAWKVITKEDGFSSTLKINELPDFYRQIKDNTGYIIHPDEVLADNFSFIMVEKNSPQYTSKFSAEGKKLLKDVEAILKER